MSLAAQRHMARHRPPCRTPAGLSPSGLAKKAGLSSTAFNESKRVTASRKRWPSTESIAHILRATGTTLDEFVALASPAGEVARASVPMIGTDAARKESAFGDEGRPSGTGWGEMNSPGVTDAHAFAFEIDGKNWEPVYREGDRLILSPAEKPRRGDRVALRTAKGEPVSSARLGRESARTIEILSLAPSAPAVALAANEIKAWMWRIVWASQ